MVRRKTMNTIKLVFMVLYNLLNNQSYLLELILNKPRKADIQIIRQQYQTKKMSKLSPLTCQLQTCSNKHCPQNNYNQQKTGPSQLCPVCAERYKQQCYCIYCNQVYFQTTDDGKNWIECDECKGWVHQQCADVQIKRNQPQASVSYKCIKCKKVESKDIGAPGRRSAITRAQPKLQKKTETGTFFNIGFQWALKPEQIAEDMKKLQAYLKE